MPYGVYLETEYGTSEQLAVFATEQAAQEFADKYPTEKWEYANVYHGQWIPTLRIPNTGPIRLGVGSPDDVRRIQGAINEAGYCVSAAFAEHAWRVYSIAFGTAWLKVPEVGVWEEVKGYVTEGEPCFEGD